MFIGLILWLECFLSELSRNVPYEVVRGTLELECRFVRLISKIVISSNESAHALKFSKAKTFAGEGALDCGAVHCSIEFVSIDLVRVGG